MLLPSLARGHKVSAKYYYELDFSEEKEIKRGRGLIERLAKQAEEAGIMVSSMTVLFFYFKVLRLSLHLYLF